MFVKSVLGTGLMLKIRLGINFMVRSEQMLHSGRLQPRLDSKGLLGTDTLAYISDA
jgi:hypothetical protein